MGGENGMVINARGQKGTHLFTGKAEKMDVRETKRERGDIYHFVINCFMIESPNYNVKVKKIKILLLLLLYTFFFES